jgi:hypothetical protein
MLHPMRRTNALLLMGAVLALALGAEAMTVTPGSDGVQGDVGPAYLDATTGQLWCSQDNPVSVKLPAQVSPVAWPACSTVTVASTDICSNTANGIPCLDGSGLLSPAVVANTLTGVNGIGFVTGTATNSVTSTATATASNTSTASGTGTLPTTQTASFLTTGTATNTITQVDPTWTWTQTSTGTQTHSVTETWSFTGAATGTVTVTGTTTLTQSGTLTLTDTTSLSATVTGTTGSTATATGTVTSTLTRTATGTQTTVATMSSTATASTTATQTTTLLQVVTGTGTGTEIRSPGNTWTRTVTGTITGSATGTYTFTSTGTGTASAVSGVFATLTGTVTDTSTSYATVTTVTIASNPTITYNAPLSIIPGADRFMSWGEATDLTIYLGFDQAPYTESAGVGYADPTASPTIGSPAILYGCPSHDGSCPVLNRSVPTDTSVASWVSEGAIQVWAWVSSTDVATVTASFDVCAGGYLTGTAGLGTASWSVSASGWHRYYGSVPMPNGLLMPTNSQFCVRFVASTSSGTPTVTLGTTYPHFTRVNGPWK